MPRLQRRSVTEKAAVSRAEGRGLSRCRGAAAPGPGPLRAGQRLSHRGGRPVRRKRRPAATVEKSPADTNGCQPSAWQPDWLSLYVGKTRTGRQGSRPEPPNAGTGPTCQQHARCSPAARSLVAPSRTSTSPGTRLSAPRLACRAGLSPSPKGVSDLGNPSAASGWLKASRPCLNAAPQNRRAAPRMPTIGALASTLGQRRADNYAGNPQRAYSSQWLRQTIHR